MMIEPHFTCPAFDLPITPDGRISNISLIGQPFVLFLYPKDNTPTCTNEALAFAAATPEFAALGCRVIGCSADSLGSHLKFQVKHGFDIPLISDRDLQLITPLGAWVEKKMYGRTYMGIDRSTFLFDSQGMAQHCWRGVRVKGHVDDVLAAARALWWRIPADVKSGT